MQKNGEISKTSPVLDYILNLQKCHEKRGKKSLDLAKGSLLNFEVKKQGEDGPDPLGIHIPQESSIKLLQCLWIYTFHLLDPLGPDFLKNILTFCIFSNFFSIETTFRGRLKFLRYTHYLKEMSEKKFQVRPISTLGDMHGASKFNESLLYGEGRFLRDP